MSSTAMPVDWLALVASFCTTVAFGTFCISADVAGQRTSGYSTLMGINPNCARFGFAVYNMASNTMNLACGVAGGVVGGAVGGATVTTRWALQLASVKSISAERPRPPPFATNDWVRVGLTCGYPTGSPANPFSSSRSRTRSRVEGAQ